MYYTKLLKRHLKGTTKKTLEEKVGTSAEEFEDGFSLPRLWHLNWNCLRNINNKLDKHNSKRIQVNLMVIR